MYIYYTYNVIGCSIQEMYQMEVGLCWEVNSDNKTVFHLNVFMADFWLSFSSGIDQTSENNNMQISPTSTSTTCRQLLNVSSV